MQSLVYKPSVALIRRPQHVVRKSVMMPTRKPDVRMRVSPDMLDTLNVTSYFVGKGIILFTMFYCTMNWAYYRGIRKDMEKAKEDDTNKKNKK